MGFDPPIAFGEPFHFENNEGGGPRAIGDLPGHAKAAQRDARTF
jgi:hypothetical protein